MVVSRCRGIGPSSGIPSSGLFLLAADYVVIQLLRVSISQSTGILGIPLPALLSNIGRITQSDCATRPGG